MTKGIAKTLNMNAIEILPPNRTRPITPSVDRELEEDLRQARIDVKEVAAIGIQAVAEAAELASQSQHDRLYTALSSLMKSTLEANRELIDTHRSRIELTGEREIGDVTNNLFIGSTAELLAMLDAKEDEK